MKRLRRARTARFGHHLENAYVGWTRTLVLSKLHGIQTYTVSPSTLPLSGELGCQCHYFSVQAIWQLLYLQEMSESQKNAAGMDTSVSRSTRPDCSWAIARSSRGRISAELKLPLYICLSWPMFDWTSVRRASMLLCASSLISSSCTICRCQVVWAIFGARHVDATALSSITVTGWQHLPFHKDPCSDCHDWLLRAT